MRVQAPYGHKYLPLRAGERHVLPQNRDGDVLYPFQLGRGTHGVVGKSNLVRGSSHTRWLLRTNNPQFYFECTLSFCCSASMMTGSWKIPRIMPSLDQFCEIQKTTSLEIASASDAEACSAGEWRCRENRNLFSCSKLFKEADGVKQNCLIQNQFAIR